MGVLEKESKKKTRITLLKKVILRTIATAGFLAVALLAPNALRVFKSFGNKIAKQWDVSVKKSLSGLIEERLVFFEEKDGKKFLHLTGKGKRKLQILELVDFKLKKPKRWDFKWRILIFDIKEKRKRIRNKLRETLVKIGFCHLQDSVWIYPYDCEDLITLLKLDFKIGKDVLYIIADMVENDKPLKEFFGL